MVPSGDPTRETVRKLADVLEPGDLVIDGGNSRYTDDGPNAALLLEQGHRLSSTAASPAASGARRTATA